jgi:hypothetical protein
MTSPSRCRLSPGRHPAHIGRRRTGRVSGEPALTSLEELLRPRVIHAFGDALAPAQLSDRISPRRPSSTMRIFFSAAWCFSRRPPNVADKVLGRHGSGGGFLSHLRSLAATMSQKSSVPQAARFVSGVLKRDTPNPERPCMSADRHAVPNPVQSGCATRGSKHRGIPDQRSDAEQYRRSSGAQHRGRLDGHRAPHQAGHPRAYGPLVWRWTCWASPIMSSHMSNATSSA